MPRSLRLLFVVTDLGFIAYWTTTALMTADLVQIPAELLFKDYSDPNIAAWNWSFMPLDLLASFTGLLAVVRVCRGQAWIQLATISMALTFCAGFMALSFWAFQETFDASWWLPNLFLCAWPLLLIKTLKTQEA